MPKLSIDKSLFLPLLDFHFDKKAFPLQLNAVKAELEEETENILKVEFNDTNRPDLWSCAGLARQLNLQISGKRNNYQWISSLTTQKANKEIFVDQNLKTQRPFIAAFIAKGCSLSEKLLQELIQVQEKVSQNYGQKRRRVAIGLYNAQKLEFPLSYEASMAKEAFIPLGREKLLSLSAILEEHPKGREFGHLLEGFATYPLLKDSKGQILSFPPIINSVGSGELKIGDSGIFFESTGTDWHQTLLVCSIFAALLADHSFEIETIQISYPRSAGDITGSLAKNFIPQGTGVSNLHKLNTPYAFQNPMILPLQQLNTLLGTELCSKAAQEALQKQGFESHCLDGDPNLEKSQTILEVSPIFYRNDILDPVDLVEEVLISLGLENFSVAPLQAFSQGALSKTSFFQEHIKELLIGLGFQEMVYNQLVSFSDYTEKSLCDSKELIRIKNPISENYNCLRSSLFPLFLATEAASQHVLYPHYFFELGESTKRTTNKISYQLLVSFFMADKAASITKGLNILNALMYYLDLDKIFSVQRINDPRLIAGRTGRLYLKKTPFGLIGEIHPQVLENWGINMPCLFCQWDLNVAKKFLKEEIL